MVDSSSSIPITTEQNTAIRKKKHVGNPYGTLHPGCTIGLNIFPTPTAYFLVTEILATLRNISFLTSVDLYLFGPFFSRFNADFLPSVRSLDNTYILIPLRRFRIHYSLVVTHMLSEVNLGHIFNTSHLCDLKQFSPSLNFSIHQMEKILTPIS